MASKKANKTAPTEAPETKERSLQGTVTLYKNPRTGFNIYIRGKKIFMRDPATPWKEIREVTTIEAGYRIRREYAAVEDKSMVTISELMKRSKSGADASLKLDRVMKLRGAKAPKYD